MRLSHSSFPPRFSRYWVRPLLVQALIFLALATTSPTASANPTPTPDANPSTPAVDRPKFTSKTDSKPTSSTTDSSSRSWLNNLGIGLALALITSWFVYSKYRDKTGNTIKTPKSSANHLPVRVINRVHLTPKHGVYFLKIRDRILIVGTGPQGAPNLLGEMAATESETDSLLEEARSS